VIVNASRPSQLDSSPATASLELPADALAEIGRILGLERFERHVV